MSSDYCCCLKMRVGRETKESTRHRFILRAALRPGVLDSWGRGAGSSHWGFPVQVRPGANRGCHPLSTWLGCTGPPRRFMATAGTWCPLEVGGPAGAGERSACLPHGRSWGGGGIYMAAGFPQNGVSGETGRNDPALPHPAWKSQNITLPPSVGDQ